VKLREQIIQQLKIKEKLKNDIQQLQRNHKADIHEREQIEHMLNRDLNAAKDEISRRLISAQNHSSSSLSVVLQSLQTEYERVMSLKKDLEKQLDERANELKTTRTVANSFTNQLKEKLEQITDAKVMSIAFVRRRLSAFLIRRMWMTKMRHCVCRFRN
jgi:chromosome segregation ATPase